MSIGAIMAGGQGQRLRGLGAKPLVPVGGQPLVAHVLNQFIDAGVTIVLVDTTTPDDVLIDAIERQCGGSMRFELLAGGMMSGTAGSVRRILEAAAGESCLVSTVDTVAPKGAYSELKEFGSSGKDRALAILATTVIHDETPIWVSVGPNESIVTDFGKSAPPAARCFGNVRWFSAEGSAAYLSISSEESTRDTEVTRMVVQQFPGRVHQLTIDPVFDVDTPADVALASGWLRSVL